MIKKKVKVLMTLHGLWPIPINEQIGPIELEEGISLVTINEQPSSVSETSQFVVNLHKRGQIEMRLPFHNHPLSKLPKMGMLFEIQERKDGGFLFMPHHYVARSMRPKTILRLFQSGEFISSLIINEMGFDISTPVSDDPDFISYEIEPKTVEPLQKFYQFLLRKWKATDVLFAARKELKTFKNLFSRLNNAAQFLDKSYFDEFAFVRTIGARSENSSRYDNYLRMIFCWFGIESLVCYGKEDKLKQLKRHLPLFLTGFAPDQILTFVDTYYEMRSFYIHADPEKMHRIRNKDLEIVQDVLKLLILVYFMVCSDESIYKELEKEKDIDPVKGLTKMNLSKYFQEMKDDSGANFESYSFKPI